MRSRPSEGRGADDLSGELGRGGICGPGVCQPLAGRVSAARGVVAASSSAVTRVLPVSMRALAQAANVIERCFVDMRRWARPMVGFVNVESVERIFIDL